MSRGHSPECLSVHPDGRSPLSVLGSWMFERGVSPAVRDNIRGAPWHLLESALPYVESRLVHLSRIGRCGDQRSHRHRSTERWLGRWAQIIQAEMRRRWLRVIA